MTLYIGLDVHGKQTLYVAQDEAGKVVRQGKVATTAEGFCHLVETLERFPPPWRGRVVSYIGLVPSTFDTGPIQRHGHITNHASRVTASCGP